MKKREYEELEIFTRQILKENFDLFDFESEVDRSLTKEENKTIILDKIELMKDNEINREIAKEQEMLEALNQQRTAKETTFNPEKIKVMVVMGMSGSGKTALCFKMLQSFKKPVYIFEHPKPKLIKALGYNTINTSKLSKLTDAVVYFDEPNLYFSKYDKTINEMFLKLCSLARQNSLSIIFSTNDSRWVNKSLESYVSHWIVKDIDISLVKNGSAIKKIVRKIMPLVTDDLELDVEEYLFSSKDDPDYNGKHTFKKPLYFTDELSKAWKPKSAK